MPCYRGPNKKGILQRVTDLAVRKGLMSAEDAEALIESSDSPPPSSDAEPGATGTISDLLTKRQEEPDEILIGSVLEILFAKENAQGFSSLSDAERDFYVVADMIGQLDNGGFSGYFYNTGHNAHFLQSALEKVGSTMCRRIVTDAIQTFGKVPSSDYDEMLEELASVTNDFEDDLWGNHDSRFYALEENLPELLMNYAESNKDQFQS